MKRPPALNSVRWHDLALAEATVQVGLKYLGAQVVNQWGARFQRVLLDDVRRRAEQRRGFTADEAPELYKDSPAPDTALELGDLMIDICREALAGLRGVEGLAEDDAPGALECLLAWELIPEVSALAQEQQHLSVRQRFRSEGASSNE